jgi:hypothetical protein
LDKSKVRILRRGQDVPNYWISRYDRAI